jgi:hypothetical protein
MPRKFIVSKSVELIDKQVGSYRAIQTKAGVFLGIIAIFLPLFLFLADKSKDYMIYVSIIPVLVVGWGLIEIVNILKAHALLIGIKEDEFQDLLNKKL